MRHSPRLYSMLVTTLAGTLASASSADAQETSSPPPSGVEALPASPTPLATESPRGPTAITRVAPVAQIDAGRAPVHAPVHVPEARQYRSWGVGSTLGGGFTASSTVGSTSSASGIAPGLVLPTLDARAFLRSGYSIDLSIPLVNLVWTSILLRGFAWSTDVFFNFNVGQGSVRFLGGPGIGFSAIGGSVYGTTFGGASLRLPGVVGLEVLTAGRGFGFQIMMRPWMEFAVAGASTATGGAVGGGMMFLIGFFGYGTRDR